MCPLFKLKVHWPVPFTALQKNAFGRSVLYISSPSDISQFKIRNIKSRRDKSISFDQFTHLRRKASIC